MSDTSAVSVIDLIPSKKAPLPSIERAALSGDEFWERYVSPQKPVLIKGGAAHWPSIEKWTDLPALRSAATRAGEERAPLMQGVQVSPLPPKEQVPWLPLRE